MFNKIKPKIALIAAGGTGGHIFPALEVAKRLRSEGFTVHWVGTKNGLEAEIIPKNSIPISYLTIGGIRGKGIKDKIIAPFKLLVSLSQALLCILKVKPRVILGMGGYVSGPVGMAAFILRKKLVIHEQNSIVGTTNKVLARFADKVLYAFPDTFNDGPPSKYVFTGNPVRQQFNDLLSPNKRFARRTNPLKILVLGGSRGAQAINDCMVETLAKWQASTNSVLPQVWHQTGAKLFAQTESIYKKYNISRVKLEPFIDNMPAAYAWADLVIARSGALTIAELMAAGVGSILIPFPHAIDDHQTTNAKHLEQNQAAVIIKQNELTPTRLLSVIKGFVTNRESLINMANNAYCLNNDAAAEKVVSFCR